MEQIFEWQSWLMNKPIYFGIFFVVMWVITSFIISKITGWSRLAEKYRTRRKPKSKLLLAVQVHWGSTYMAGNIYTIGCNTEGMYLGVLFPFRVGHPPLLIPWHDIKTSKISGLIKSRIQLNFGNNLSRPFEIYDKTAQKIKERSNGQFNY